MENRNLKINIKDIDMGTIDEESFGESLLACFPKIDEFCESIDSKINFMAMISFIPYSNSMAQYNDIIENMEIKNQLLELRRTVKLWSKGLTSKQKKLYHEYFVKNNTRKYQQERRYEYRRNLDILPMVRQFMWHLRLVSICDEKSLIKNPYIYRMYSIIKRRNEHIRNCGFAYKKGERNHDSSTNEKRNP